MTSVPTRSACAPWLPVSASCSHPQTLLASNFQTWILWTSLLGRVEWRCGLTFAASVTRSSDAAGLKTLSAAGSRSLARSVTSTLAGLMAHTARTTSSATIELRRM